MFHKFITYRSAFIKLTFFISLLTIFPSCSPTFQPHQAPKTVKDAEKLIDKEQKQKQKQALKEKEKAKKAHLKMQSKAVKKRIKKSNKKQKKRIRKKRRHPIF